MKRKKEHDTPWTLGGTRSFQGERYTFVANFSTKAKADANAKLQRRNKMKARVWKWERSDGETLYAVYIRRSKRFRF